LVRAGITFNMHISDFDYELPDELIAQHPLPERAASRMLVVNRVKQTWSDSHFRLLPEFLEAGDVLVLNNTQVFPARLQGRRVPSGGGVELMLIREVDSRVWEALARPARRLRKGARVEFGDSRLQAEVVESLDHGIRLIRFEGEQPLDRLIDELGAAPLPPYIKRPASAANDKDRYQTIYASKRGAIAAPTAGLHFTREVLSEIKSRQTAVVEITLHVGYGTFEPVRVDEVSGHRVAPEWVSISAETARTINETRTRGGRVVAVGTTTARALESTISPAGQTDARSGLVELTMVPGYKFRAVDALLTNFHLPRSSLLLLVSAFAGRDLILEAYRYAVKSNYRFYSYGDCMLIL
jgi:S-adenosylmethionine:tRNA ribosyltransferase-isomerase